jgi:hypothetical protein
MPKERELELAKCRAELEQVESRLDGLEPLRTKRTRS